MCVPRYVWAFNQRHHDGSDSGVDKNSTNDQYTKIDNKDERIALRRLYLLFTNWVQGPYQEIQAQGFSYSPSLRGLFGKSRACISWYGTSTQLVNSLLHDPFLESDD